MREEPKPLDRKQRAKDCLEALAELGVDVDGCKTMIDMSSALRAHGFKMQHAERYSEHVKRFLDAHQVASAAMQPEASGFMGRPAPPRSAVAFRPYQPDLGLRINQERAQAAYGMEDS